MKHTALKITLVVLLLIVVAVCASVGVLYATGNIGVDGAQPPIPDDENNSSPSEFFIKVNGQRTTSDVGGYMFAVNQPLLIEVKGDFDVRIVPNVSADDNFDFLVDGTPMSFIYERDFSAGFTFIFSAGGFTVAPKGGLRDILAYNYPDSAVEANISADITDKEIIAIEIISSDKLHSIRISGAVKTPPSGVVLDPTEIEF